LNLSDPRSVAESRGDARVANDDRFVDLYWYLGSKLCANGEACFSSDCRSPHPARMIQDYVAYSSGEAKPNVEDDDFVVIPQQMGTH